MSRNPHTFSAFALFATAVAVQPFVAADPVVHMLVQFLLLVASGYVLGVRLRLPFELIGPVLVCGITVLLFWMLPRSLDGALTSWPMHIAKFVTLPLFVGLPLGLTWPVLGPILRGFLKAQSVSMAGVMGFLYTHAPIRICNSYLVDDQIRLGFGFFFLATSLAFYWSLPVLIGHPLTLAHLLPGKFEHDLR